MNKKNDTRNLFKQEFFKSEKVHELTDDELNKLQKAELEILKSFIEVVKKYNLSYSLGGGSVLGAVRHKGFIPWDDDVDINMPRADYEKFAAVFEKELGNRYDLCTPEDTRGYGLAHVQIKKKNTVYRSFNELSQEKCGILVDIFVEENVPDNALLRKLHGTWCLGWGYLLTCRKTYFDYKYLKEYIESSEVLKKKLGKKVRIGRLFSFLPLDYVTKRTVHIYKMCKNSNTKCITFPTGRKHYFGEIGLRKEMVETVEVPFEDITVNIPKGYDEYLKRLYGPGYMALPKEADRERHPVMELMF